MADLIEAINEIFRMCDLNFWFGETYWRNVNGEESESFPDLDYEDFSIVNAFWAMLDVLLLYAEKKGCELGLKDIGDCHGIMSFTEPIVDDGFGIIAENAWLNALEKYGYEYPEELNFSPKAGNEFFEDSPCVTKFAELEHEMQLSLACSDILNENSEGLSDEDYLKSRYDDIEFSADDGSFIVYCLVNNKLWELQKMIKASGLNLDNHPELLVRYRNVCRKVGSVCDSRGCYADGEALCFSDGRTAEYSLIEGITDECGYDLLFPPILYYANIPAIFKMEEIDSELMSVTEEVRALIELGKEKYEQKKKSPCT